MLEQSSFPVCIQTPHRYAQRTRTYTKTKDLVNLFDAFRVMPSNPNSLETTKSGTMEWVGAGARREKVAKRKE